MARGIPLLNMSPEIHDETPLQSSEAGSSLSRKFHPREQSWRLFREQMPHLACTILAVVITLVTLKIYESKGYVEHNRKVSFNALITVLNIVLALNFLEAFKSMAKVLRWRVLADRGFTVRETDLILGSESLMKLTELMLESFKKPLVFFICLVWIVFNIIAQVSIAVTGLMYSWDGGSNSSGTTWSDDTVLFPKLDCYYDNGTCATAEGRPPEIAPNLAHSYGELIASQFPCSYSSDDDILSSNQTCDYFYSTTSHEFAYRYSEFNPQDLAGGYPFLTNRIIKASSGKCFQYDAFFNNQKDRFGMTLWTFNDGKHNNTISIPVEDTAFDSTTYVYNGTLTPQKALEQPEGQACGSRCLNIFALRELGTIRKGGQAQLFKCPITVGTVSNAGDNPAHALSDDNARLAAASIALTGRYTNLLGPVKEWRQYRLYPYGSSWETDKLDADTVGGRIAQFAIGSLAAMAGLNPRSPIQGTLPTLGYHLSIHWNYIIALAVTIAGVHCILIALTLWIAHPIVVGEDSNLVTARLLRGLVGRLDGRGVLLDGKEIARAIEAERGGRKEKVIYGIKEEKIGRILELDEDAIGRNDQPRKRFPRGEYA